MPTYNRIRFETGKHAKSHGIQEMHGGQEKRLLNDKGEELDLKDDQQYSYKLIEEDIEPPWHGNGPIEPPKQPPLAPEPEPIPEISPHQVEEPEPEVPLPATFHSKPALKKLTKPKAVKRTKHAKR